MADVLVDFLNHGALPFVGRKAEQERVLRFWSDRGNERLALETLLLTGEAGVGKSRLIEETIPLIESRSGAVVHIRLRPEGSTSLIPLIVSGIERSESARSLFRPLPSDTYSAALGALRRLCALRRTLLVVEDIHLLEGASLHEFSLLLEGLRDESLGLLAAARPVESQAIDLLQTSITDEIKLEGLDAEEIEELWQKLFKDRSSGGISAMLKETTHGNALALRSALRGGVRVGSMKKGNRGDRLEVEIEPWAFTESARRATRAVVTGMIAGLDSDLLQKACRLALLGEVFSPQAAAEVAENGEEVIAALIFKGILTRTTTSSTPINTRERKEIPISFTHSLVHNDLLKEAPESIEEVVRVIASGAPIYTYLPYRIVQGRSGRLNLPGKTIAAAARECAATSRLVNMGLDWRNATPPLEAAERIMESLPEEFDEDEKNKLAAILLWVTLETRVRRYFDETHRELAERLLALTSHTPHLFEYRLIALEHLIRNATDLGKGDGREPFDEAVAFAESHPEARRSIRYTQVLYVTATAAHTRDDRAMLRRIEELVEQLLEDPGLPDRERLDIILRLRPSFLTLVESREEFRNRMDRLEELKRLAAPLTPDIFQADLVPYFHIQSFYLTAGLIDELAELSEKFTLILHRHGLAQSYYLTKRWHLLAECLLGKKDIRNEEPWKRLAAEVRADTGLSEPEKTRLELSIARTWHNGAYMMGDLTLMEAILSLFEIPIDELAVANRMIHTLWRKDYPGFLETARQLPPETASLASIVARASATEQEEEERIEKSLEHLRDLPYDLFQLVRIYITVEILEQGIAAGYIDSSKEKRERIRTAIRQALLHSLTMMADRRLPLLMEPVIRRYGDMFSRNERRVWEDRIHELKEGRKQSQATVGSEQIRISMFDAVTVTFPGRERERLRGGRSATLLGLLTANRMLKYPLDRLDFFALASGVENDPDRARTATNVAVLRLREVIGKEGIRTGNDLPELNDRLIRIDLLDVWEGLERGEKELHNGHLLNAREAAREAVLIAAGNVPFPGLYEELFERLREDVETRLRNLVLRVAERLVTADDPKEAEELLRLWNERVPEDEEGLLLMAELLERSGERAQAVAVRSRGTAVES